jgi:hypothetical protein
VDDAKLSHTNRQLPVAPISRVKDEAVAGTVHWFESPFLFFHIEQEHVVFIVLPMARGLPKLAVVHVWGDDWKQEWAKSNVRCVLISHLPDTLVCSTRTMMKSQCMAETKACTGAYS